jgi:type IV pilus assembly protein PilN
MRNIDASPWLEKPELVEIRASTVDKKRVSEFNMNMSVKRVQAPADKGAKGAKPAAAAKKG